ncbi:MAG TPA: helical backbone metal receptor [Myxococcota bacterium]|nr:helical backbone metal receptor [Myxococcota bacterium]
MLETDALGREHEFSSPPRRIVSLVPSWTETLFALGAGDAVVGATEYCVHPAERVARVPRIGGTKNPNVRAIAALGPDLVIANKEENRERDVERLEAAGLRVFVTYARGVAEAVREMRALGRIVARAGEADAIGAEVESLLAQLAERMPARRPRVVALVWRDPLMVVGGDTFASDLLACAGAHNPFAVVGGGRYPRIERGALEAAAPDVLLLPTEPYRFAQSDRRELLELDCPAARSGRIHILEGELLSWYGPRMPRALKELSELFNASD